VAKTPQPAVQIFSVFFSPQQAAPCPSMKGFFISLNLLANRSPLLLNAKKQIFGQIFA
jgi:hypothetical protein